MDLSTSPPTSSSASASTTKLTWKEKFDMAKTYKEEGNEKYKGHNYKAAIGKYHRALLYMKGITDPQDGRAMMGLVDDTSSNMPQEIKVEVSKLKTDCYNNLAACLLQTENPNYEKICSYCSQVLEIESDNVKALYRKGVSLYHTNNPEDAIVWLHKAQKYPCGKEDNNIKKYVAMCEVQIQQQDKVMKKRYQAMFKSMSLNEDET